MSRELRVELETVQAEISAVRRQLELETDPALETRAADAEAQCRALHAEIDLATGDAERAQLTFRTLAVDLEAREADLRRAQQKRLNTGVLFAVVVVLVVGLGLAPIAAWRGWNAVIVAVGMLSATALGLLNPERKKAALGEAMPAGSALVLCVLAVLWSFGAAAVLIDGTLIDRNVLTTFFDHNLYGPLPWLISPLLSVPTAILVFATRGANREARVMQTTVLACLAVLVFVGGWGLVQSTHGWGERAGQLMLLVLALVIAAAWTFSKPQLKTSLSWKPLPLELAVFAIWFVIQSVLAGGIVNEQLSSWITAAFDIPPPPVERFSDFIDGMFPVIEPSGPSHMRHRFTRETDLLAILAWLIAGIGLLVAWRRRELLRRGRIVLPVVLGVLALIWLVLRAPVFFS